MSQKVLLFYQFKFGTLGVFCLREENGLFNTLFLTQAFYAVDSAEKILSICVFCAEVKVFTKVKRESSQSETSRVKQKLECSR